MLITFALLVSLPFWIDSVGLYQYLGVEIVIWMVFALGFNLLLGYTGLPSFGHGAYFGIGAYAFGLSQLHLAESLWLGILCAMFFAALGGALVATFLSHRRGIYYALLTIAFGQVFWFLSIKWHRLTGGEDGLLNIPRPDLDLGFVSISLASNQALFYFVLALFVLVVIGLWRLIHSPFGTVIKAIKQNEMRTSFIGYNVWLYKWSVFTLSASIAGRHCASWNSRTTRARIWRVSSNNLRWIWWRFYPAVSCVLSKDVPSSTWSGTATGFRIDD